MKNSLEIIKFGGKYILVSGYETIQKGDKFLHINANNVPINGDAVPRKVETFQGSIGYTGHMGASFLCFREPHRKFIKYITQTDLKKLAIKRRYNRTYKPNPDTF